ncbi:hypothetical protein AKJ48_02475 [candidate division MSBL1 archaeon SCGC-AAA261O19]|uniref:Metallo-beta-lactamase domain-containing protein n=2 Tax=candidate division MSBL1 TaxID=215777 RepID=A0A133UYU8_9EURY|nr:hypothetical protein AKJ42_03350 [candidate division MSBL1 archaeon SCGC-AAA261C02]KXB04460.1 hypothetical protein AKJ48_02475 [candidate division MSBL1 archaeon SCGC-AAA261O19]
MEIVDDIHWVGAYFKEKGAVVNPFLLKGDKNLLIDVGPKPLADTLIENIQEILDPSEIDYVFLTHGAEYDHSGGLEEILGEATNASVNGHEIASMLIPMYGFDVEVESVKVGDSIDLGGKKLTFVEPPLSDTPDTLWAFEEENKVLFTSDTFGSFKQPGEEWELFLEDDLETALKEYHLWKFPWLKLASEKKLEEKIEEIKELEPEIIATYHGSLIKSSENVNKALNSVKKLAST